ncbi:hypothetical protein OSB04_027363 [Centaurea solstitialis]|uniref:Uncharacterized protein n=1 Tax=Centaurea solstitialis TaxID=347529 RepID=A0AA38VZN0_9ASTR|nr:hypothetical protein OSB04_027363 [Centaurea solstitialis]
MKQNSPCTGRRDRTGQNRTGQDRTGQDRCPTFEVAVAGRRTSPEREAEDVGHRRR